MTDTCAEMTAYMLLSAHGMKALDVVIQHCDEAAKVGDEEALAFWNDVFDFMFGWNRD